MAGFKGSCIPCKLRFIAFHLGLLLALAGTAAFLAAGLLMAGVI